MGSSNDWVLYKTIENSNIKINRKILLSNDNLLIFVRTRYHKVETENKKMFYIDNLLHDKHFISFFSLKKIPK